MLISHLELLLLVIKFGKITESEKVICTQIEYCWNSWIVLRMNFSAGKWTGNNNIDVLVGRWCRGWQLNLSVPIIKRILVWIPDTLRIFNSCPKPRRKTRSEQTKICHTWAHMIIVFLDFLGLIWPFRSILDNFDHFKPFCIILDHYIYFVIFRPFQTILSISDCFIHFWLFCPFLTVLTILSLFDYFVQFGLFCPFWTIMTLLSVL